MAFTGIVHSVESLGAVDGPGLRYVVFMQGCPLRCAYCHNPDTWEYTGGEELTAARAAQNALRYKPYWKTEGGVTVGGGEPLAQSEFVAELFSLLQAQGVHTALDTSGMGEEKAARKVLEHTNLVLADLKFLNTQDYRTYCGGEYEQVLRFLRLSEEMGVPLWIRHVVVPGLSDGEDHLRQLAAQARAYKNLEKIELLAFKKFCTVKYDAMGIPFPLRDVPEMKDEDLAVLQKLVEEE